MKKYLPLAIIVILLVIITSAVLIAHKSGSPAQTVAQPIPADTSFADAKKLSVGKKPACLSNVKTASDAVEAVITKNSAYTFNLILGSKFIDMPAGYTTTTVHSFDGKTATGTNSYTDKNQKSFAGDLKSFNYVMQLDPANNNWSITSYIACN